MTGRRLVHRLRWLGAVVAVFVPVVVAVALTVITPAGATGYHAPRVSHCHIWPHTTEVHWNTQWLYEYGGSYEVANIEWRWDGAAPGPTNWAFKGGENAVADTPMGAQAVRVTLTLANGRVVETFPVYHGCSGPEHAHKDKSTSVHKTD